MLRIKRASNGFILEFPDPDFDDEQGMPGIIQEVIEFDSTFPHESKRELHQLRSLLYAILEHVGYHGSKHNEYRLRVIVEHQNPPEKIANLMGELQEKLGHTEWIMLEAEEE